ncbi:MAG: hypothetical protein ACRESK_08295 [Gammaproteobacteria bacterium]
MGFKSDAGKFKRNLEALLNDKLDQAAQETADHIKEKLSGGMRGSMGTGRQGEGEPPRVETGRLRNSIFWDRMPNKKMGRIIGVQRDEQRPGRSLVLEFGAVIRAKKGTYLAIPWSSQAKAHSVGGGSARTFQPRGKRLYKVGRSAKTFFLVEKVRGKHARGIIHYIITTSVDIKPHPFLRPAFDEMRGRIQDILKA